MSEAALPERASGSAPLVSIPSPPSSPIELEPGSYRDRNGAVFYREGRVFRRLSPKALENWLLLRQQTFFQSESAAGRIVGTRAAEGEAGPAGEEVAEANVLEHDRIPFISYPYEWAFGMLKDAALLHLDLMRQALAVDMILKDSSAYNVQWQRVHPESKISADK